MVTLLRNTFQYSSAGTVGAALISSLAWRPPILLGTVTLGGDTNAINVAGMTTTGYNQLLVIWRHGSSGAGTTCNLGFNGDGGNNYQYERTIAAGAAISCATAGTQPYVNVMTGIGSGEESFGYMLISNVQAIIKAFVIVNGYQGQSTTITGSWSNAADLIARVQISTSANNFTASSGRSFMSVYGISM